MTKEKLLSLQTYLTQLQSRLNSPTPNKHLARPNEYKQYLMREIEIVRATIERGKLG